MNRIRSARLAEQTLNIAHRGGRAFAPENTDEAIVKAKRAGADMVEIDVQMSSDGVPIVFHDDDLTARTDVRARFPDRMPWRVDQFTAAELKSLDAGSWFAAQIDAPAENREPYLKDVKPEELREFLDAADVAGFRSGTVHPPRLREALECAKGLGLLVNVEIKSLPRRHPALVRAVAEVIRELEMSSSVIASSFDHEYLIELRAIDSGIATAVLTRDRLADPVVYVRDLCAADALHPGCSGDSDSLSRDPSGGIDAAMIAALRAAGLLVNAWTENDPARMRVLIDAGVSGIITDYPNRLADVIRRHRRC